MATLTEQQKMLYNQESEFRPRESDYYSYGYGGNYLQPETTAALNRGLAAREAKWQSILNPANSPSYDQSSQALGFGDENSSSWLGNIKDVLENEGLMKGMLGAGQLGLGLMSYLDSSRLMNEQLKGLKQNRRQAAQSFADQQAQRAAINKGFSSAINP